MIPHARQHQIDTLQQLRHHLLLRRQTEKSGSVKVAIDIQLNMVRNELHALYAQKYFACSPCAANDPVRKSPVCEQVTQPYSTD